MSIEPAIAHSTDPILAMMNLAQLLSETAARYATKPAVNFEGTVWTYGEFDRRVAIYAARLHEAGIQPGDRVAIQLPKCMEFLWLHLAVLSVGAITLPLNPEYRTEEVVYFLRDAGCQLYVGDRDMASELSEPLMVWRLAELRDCPADPIAFERPYPTGDEDVAMICYTSGTTGRSKGAMITHRNLIVNLHALIEAWEWSDRDVLLHVLPLFHVHGLNVAAHGSLSVGATMIMQEKFEATRVWRTLESAGCTQFMGVPTLYQRLYQRWHAWQETRSPLPDLSTMRVFISGSAPLSDLLFDRFAQTTGFRILERYGMTETGMNVSNPIAPSDRVPKSVGFPLPGVEIRVVRDGDDAAIGEVGEVWIRGDHVFRGYWGMPDKTEESFVEGWFRSGDLGYQDPGDRGRLYLVGRAKELIISGGLNVYPKEVELVLERQAAVKEAAVIGVPDEDLGERVVAAVVLQDGIEAIVPEDLIAACKQTLVSYKCPKQIYFLPELPRNAMGKIQKHLIDPHF